MCKVGIGAASGWLIDVNGVPRLKLNNDGSTATDAIFEFDVVHTDSDNCVNAVHHHLHLHLCNTFSASK